MDEREAHEFYKDPAHLAVAGPGRKPARPAMSKMVAVRFMPEMIARVKRWAEEDGITVSGWIRRVVTREEERRRRLWLDAHRHELKVVPGSGRLGVPRAIPSSLGRGVFACQHMSIGNVTGASCGTCGPLSRVA